MKKYFVSGGEYLSSAFDKIDPKTFQEHGPFDSYRLAQDCWQELSMKHIDYALTRFQILVREDKDQFWVVGGIYTDTKFETLDPQCNILEYGPYSDIKLAEKQWRDISMRYIDDALARFRVEQR